MKPNVLFIIDSFEQGGSERQALQLLRQLHESGQVRVRLACLQDRGSLKQEAEQLGVGEIHEYPLTSFYDLNFVKQLGRLVSYVRENKIDVIHTHCFYTNIFGMTGGFLAGVPARVTSKGETDGFRTPLQKRVERMSFRLGHRVIANCLVVREMLIREGVNPQRVIQHYNGLDLARMKVLPDISRDRALAKLNLPAGKRFVTIVANLRNPVKDHPMFLRAAARVRATVPDAAFVIAGEGELMPSLRELAAELGIDGDVHFIGRCDYVAMLLHASNVGVLSSKAEGFANAILEYMAADLPVVATDVGGVREAIVEGETGYVVASGDDEQMAQRLIQVLANDENARAMGLRGKAMVAEKFSSEHHLRNTLELYDELLARRPDRTTESSIRQQNETAPKSRESFALAQAFTPGIENVRQTKASLRRLK
ncbi:MAG TPA: glycosyltransferase [Pyrinomonadaceae bacterium]|nr:glycosyltransferase [Pyrinomonadaceae bacterium]